MDQEAHAGKKGIEVGSDSRGGGKRRFQDKACDLVIDVLLTVLRQTKQDRLSVGLPHRTPRRSIAEGESSSGAAGWVENPQVGSPSESLTGSGAPEVVLQTDGAIESPRAICRDGRYLVYAHAETCNARFGVWVLPMFGDRKPFPLVEGQFEAFDPRISPNCKWVAYLSEEPGQEQIYITSFPDGKRKYQATTAGGDNPRWRGDGKELFFMSPEGNLEAVGVEDRREFRGVALRLQV